MTPTAPEASSPQRGHLSDLVLDSELDTVDLGNGALLHVFHQSGQSAHERYVRTEERWVRETTLGSGAYGTVFRERCDGGGETRTRAVKEIKKGVLAREGLDYARELEAVIKFSHRRYSHCFVRSDGWFELADSIFIAMEYLPLGDLGRFLPVDKPMPEIDTRQIVSQILEGLGYMHKNGFVHRDLKPGNIMVVTKGPAWFVKIADFGISKRRQADIMSHTTYRGTLGFAAPEQLGLRAKDPTAFSSPFALDMWSLGAMAYRIATGYIPFGLTDLVEYVSGIKDFPSMLQEVGVSENGQEFVRGLMAPAAGSRLDVVSASQHQWMQVPALTLPSVDTIAGHEKEDSGSGNAGEKEPTVPAHVELDVSVASAAWSDEASMQVDETTIRPTSTAANTMTIRTRPPSPTTTRSFPPTAATAVPPSSKYRQPYAESYSSSSVAEPGSPNGLSSLLGSPEKPSSAPSVKSEEPVVESDADSQKGQRLAFSSDNWEVESVAEWSLDEESGCSTRSRSPGAYATRASYADGMSIQSELLLSEDEYEDSWESFKNWCVGEAYDIQFDKYYTASRDRFTRKTLRRYDKQMERHDDLTETGAQRRGRRREVAGDLFVKRIRDLLDFRDPYLVHKAGFARLIFAKIMAKSGSVSLSHDSQWFKARVENRFGDLSSVHPVRDALDAVNGYKHHINWFADMLGDPDNPFFADILKCAFYTLLHKTLGKCGDMEWTKKVCQILKAYCAFDPSSTSKENKSVLFLRHVLGLVTLPIDLGQIERDGRAHTDVLMLVGDVARQHREYMEQNLSSRSVLLDQSAESLIRKHGL